jgi:hypothetical protein
MAIASSHRLLSEDVRLYAEQGSFFVGGRMVQGKGRSCCGLVAYAANLH